MLTIHLFSHNQIMAELRSSLQTATLIQKYETLVITSGKIQLNQIFNKFGNNVQHVYICSKFSIESPYVT